MQTIKVLTPQCPFCGDAHELEVPEYGYFQWREGALIQEALPELSLAERELLMSGVDSECWTKYMRDPDD